MFLSILSCNSGNESWWIFYGSGSHTWWLRAKLANWPFIGFHCKRVLLRLEQLLLTQWVTISGENR